MVNYKCFSGYSTLKSISILNIFSSFASISCYSSQHLQFFVSPKIIKYFLNLSLLILHCIHARSGPFLSLISELERTLLLTLSNVYFIFTCGSLSCFFSSSINSKSYSYCVEKNFHSTFNEKFEEAFPELKLSKQMSKKDLQILMKFKFSFLNNNDQLFLKSIIVLQLIEASSVDELMHLTTIL